MAKLGDKVELFQPEDFLSKLAARGVGPDFLMDIAADFFKSGDIGLKTKMDAVLKIIKTLAKHRHELDEKTLEVIEKVWAVAQSRLDGRRTP